MRLPSSLTSRLVLTTVGLVALVSLLVSVATTIAMRSALIQRLDQDVRGSAEVRIGPGPAPQARRGLIAVYDGTGDISEGRSVPSREDQDEVLLTPAQMDVVEGVEPDSDVHHIELPGLGGYRVIAQPWSIRGNDVIVVRGLPTDEIDDTIADLVVWELLLTALALLLAFGAGQVVVRRTLRPLRDVAGVAQGVTRLDLARGSVGETVRVPERLTDETTEVGQVGASLNRLLGHVEQALDARHRSEQQVRQFVADASHELRTPLTTIRGYAELADRDPDVLPTSMAKVSEEAQRMTSLVEDLLLLARIDSGRPLATEPVDLTQLVVGAVDDARVVDPSKSWLLELPEEPVVVTGDEQRLHQVVTNLLGNARRHTPAGTKVTTGLVVRDGLVDLTVHDTGPGVPAGVDVFERFTRGDTSRTRASGGAGLGLSLVAAIATAHGGQVEVLSEPGDTTFTVKLPL